MSEYHQSPITLETFEVQHLNREQVHGHDFSAIAALPDRDAYASTSEEKVVRVMAAPQVFFDTQALLCGQHLQRADGGGDQVCTHTMHCPPGTITQRMLCRFERTE